MEQTNVQITQAQPTLTVEIVQNLIPVMTAQVTVGGGGGPAPVFGDTLTGTGTPADPVNVSNDILDQLNDNTQNIQDNASQIQDIQDLIPATANQNNPLVDQGFVNSSIQTATAYFRGDWATWADVPSDPELYPVDATGNHTPTTNDYMVVIADEQTNGGTWRYKYTGAWAEQGKSGWQAEYQVNETPLTAAQLAALNSGVTAQSVADITALKTGKQDKLTAGPGINIDGNTISADNAGGDYLPLGGGTMSGDIAFGTDAAIGASYLDGLIIKRYVLGSWTSLYSINSTRISPKDNGNKDLGTSSTKWRRLYVGYINNGADLIVPTEAGTIARMEDITAAVGDISTALTAILGE